MTPTVISVAIVMVAVGIASVVWLHGYRVAGAARRTMEMMTRVGLDPGAPRLGDPGTKAMMKQVRRRCMRCPREDLCDRWMAGKVSGGNAFCPNARIFGSLSKSGLSTG